MTPDDLPADMPPDVAKVIAETMVEADMAVALARIAEDGYRRAARSLWWGLGSMIAATVVNLSVAIWQLIT